MRLRRATVPAARLVAVLGLLAGLSTASAAAAGLWYAGPGAHRDVGTLPASASPWSPPPTPIMAAGAPASAAPASAAPASGRPAVVHRRPARLVVPSLGIDAAVVTVGVAPDGSLGVPDTPAHVGWWRDSAEPGAAVGGTVIDGHVDSRLLGRGAFFGLRHLRVGAAVRVVDDRGTTHAYRVVARRQYAKHALPAGELFAQAVPPRLVLVTCGGRFDRATRHYRDNVVVFAVPA